MIPEHSGEHGLGLSGLRRIRQQPLPSRDPGTPIALSRSGSLSLSPAISRSPSTTFSAMSPHLNPIEDLSRFPSESLHSFSFTHQSEESIHNRQNVLKRSMDFMRDKLGWAASNPGLIVAQAKLSGDHEVQSMVELLSRAHLIGNDANHAHGLGVTAPLTGPADVSGNVFEESFAARAESPEPIPLEMKPPTFLRDADRVLRTLSQRAEETTQLTGDITLNSLSKALADHDTELDTIPQKPRSMLKRTLTNTDELFLQKKLTDTLAQPYSMNEDSLPNVGPLKRYKT
jgi:protein-serine/threonine kinase